jgi:photosystem II stability/assembly factor-like uncharacterized protein
MRSFRSSAGRVALLVLSAAACWSVPPAARGQWAVSEFQPSVREGGRANTIAVSPKNDDLILVASETGGLFRSEDRGKTWRHVDGLPGYMLSSVAFLPDDPSVVLVTAGDDFKQLVGSVQNAEGFAAESEGGGGVWRSEDGGKSWAHVTRPPALRRRISAYDISVAPDTGTIYVGHDFGVLISNDRGKSWKHSAVVKGQVSDILRSIRSVVALEGGVVLVAGPGGVRRSADGGDNWIAPPGGVVIQHGTYDLHALVRSPSTPKHAYLANASLSDVFDTDVLVTRNGGKTWKRIKSEFTEKSEFTGLIGSCRNGLCGGVRFIRATLHGMPPAQELDLYVSNTCCVYRLRLQRDSQTGDFAHSGKAHYLTPDHRDPRDIAFDSAGGPLLLGTDGGVHTTSDEGESWKLTGGGQGGYNALQVYQVQGQYVEDMGRQDLYFGTQDNGQWSSSDGGNAWAAGAGEGEHIEAERRVPTVADSKITYKQCGACDLGAKQPCASCRNFVSDALYDKKKKWPNPAGLKAPGAAPVIVRRSLHVQAVQPSKKHGLDHGLAVTPNLGVNWHQLASFTEEMREGPKVGTPGDEGTPALLYQAVRTGYDAGLGADVVGLLRLVLPPGKLKANVSLPFMNNFGGLGVSYTGGLGIAPKFSSSKPVFGVDPGNPDHLIAADVINRRMKESHDGGDNWTEMPTLTDLVTRGGRLLFSKGNRPVVAAVSFCPDDPDLVLVVTMEGGAYLSEDNGKMWERVEGSEGITGSTSVYWTTANEAIVSTYGRGLWRLRNEEVRPHFPFEIELLCDGCDFVPVKPDPDPLAKLRFERGLLVFGGEVTGASVEAGVLKEVFVTPGSSVIFKTDDPRPAGVRVTRTSARVGYRDGRPLPAPPRTGQVIRGVVFGKDNRLLGVAFGGRRALMFTPRPARGKVGRPPYTKGARPYVRLIAPRFDGPPAASPGEAVRVTGTGFAPGSLLAVVIDGRPARRKALADAGGTFEARIRAPQEFGLHRVEIRDRRGAVLDGSTFFVSRTGDPDLTPR